MPEREQILVVDDNRPLADGFARVLSSDYDVTTAYTLEGATRSLDPAIDAVLLDRNLPDGSGDELLEEIRERGHDCPVAVISGNTRSSNLDCDAYLTKPLAETAVVLETVTDLLDGNGSI